uniref:Uncharacterized protein n=1 Tax=Panagrolaimus sp. PS1159 TaxID=55785 RepID=A0AC35EWA4_9BILA
MMKFGYIFLICALLFINFQLSGSVKCWVKQTGVEGTRKRGYGCPGDFFRDCSTQKEIIDFIKSKNYNDLVYYAYPNAFYFSGCSHECAKEKMEKLWPDNVT